MRISLSGPRRQYKKKILSFAKGFVGRPNRCCNLAKNLVVKKMKKEFIGRKQRKRDMRSLWIVRINAAARALGSTYSRLITAMQDKYKLNRKSLSEIAINNFPMFESLYQQLQHNSL